MPFDCIFWTEHTKNRSAITPICVGVVYMAACRKYKKSGLTFHPRAWHLHPSYLVHNQPRFDWLLKLFVHHHWIVVKILRVSSYQMHDCESILFTDQCVFWSLNYSHMRVYSLNCVVCWQLQLLLLDLGSLSLLQALLEKHTQTNTFTETDQSFFQTMTISCNGEETSLAAWLVECLINTTCFCVKTATYIYS